ncbi:MAG: hypothetical protein IJD17_01660, partial [Clostridia bacterium]|nr:hypothetical protein [Clostridia bacterium]
MKRSFNRVLSFILTLLMLVSMIPAFALTATAAGTLTVSDPNIGLSWTDASSSSGKASWSASGNTVTGNATGYTAAFIWGRTITTKLTITNNYSDDRTLVFDYILTGGGSVSGTISGTSGSYSNTLAAGASTTITLTSPSGSSTNTLSLKNLQLLSSGNVTSTFLAPENGSYTVDGVTVTSQTSREKVATGSYALEATPASGYMFFGWYSEATDSYVSYSATASLIFGSDPQLKPVFLPTTTALFGVGTAKFSDLTEACDFANSSASSTKTVVLLNDGTVSGEHTIPVGVTLLIPFDDANTLYRSTPECTSWGALLAGENVAWVKPDPYKTLTLASDADITVNGSISVSAKHAASNGGKPYCGAPTESAGWVYMTEGSKITLNSGANLYAWGFIQGAGTITARSGSHVYENFQFTDFRGGTNLSNMITAGLVFPINQYYVQNIEVPTIYEAGARETLYTSAYASNSVLGGSAPFIGEGGMFVIDSGYVVKDYIENRDRLQVDVCGNIDMSSMTVDVGQEVDSSEYVLPITNNITININSGTTTIKQSVALTPGVEMTIKEGAVLDIGYSETALNDYNTKGHNLVVYDRDEWFYGFDMGTGAIVENVQYAFQSPVTGMYPLPYVPGRTYNRTVANDLKDAFIDVNGTIIANGFLYTTTGGAAIKSTGKTGKIVMQNGSGFDMFTFQANGGTSLGIMMNSAALMNGDGSYLNTITVDEDFNPITYAEPGTTFNYCATHDCWYTGSCEQCYVPPKTYTITFVVDSENSYSYEYNEGEKPECKLPLVKDPDNDKHYLFACWVDQNGNEFVDLPNVSGDAVYTAKFNGFDHSFDSTKHNGNQHICTEESCNKPANCGDTNDDHKCDVGGEDFACHFGTLTHISSQPATCGADGYEAYYKCSCEKLYADDQAQTPISDLESWKTGDGNIPATGKHSFNNKVSDQQATPADCDNAATYYIQCDNCDAVSDTKTVAVGDANGHAFTTKASDQQATPA